MATIGQNLTDTATSDIQKNLGGGLAVDNQYGEQTTAAVQAFQTKNGLVADGIFGPKTQAVYNTQFGTKQPSGNAGPVAISGNGINGPLSSSTILGMNNAPDPLTLVKANGTNGSGLSDKITAVAGRTLDSAGRSADALRKTLGDTISREKEAAMTNENNISNRIATDVGKTTYADTFKSVTEKFKTEETIRLLEDVQQRMVDAQQALDMGLIYEQDRPVRTQLLTGRSSSLQKQGLATLGALQGTAAVLKGNIDLAYSYAEQTISAIEKDNNRSSDALKTLLDLESKKVMTLSKEERDTAEARIKSIEEQNKELRSNSQDISKLMISNPQLFLGAGITLLDSQTTANKKIYEYLKKNGGLPSKTNKIDSYNLAAQFIKDNPNASPKQLLSGILQNTKLNQTEAKLLIENGGDVLPFISNNIPGPEYIQQHYSDEQLVSLAKALKKEDLATFGFFAGAGKKKQAALDYLTAKITELKAQNIADDVIIENLNAVIEDPSVLSGTGSTTTNDLGRFTGDNLEFL